MIGTTALTPSLSVEVTGVESNTGLLHRAPYDPFSERTMHRTTIFGDEALT